MSSGGSATAFTWKAAPTVSIGRKVQGMYDTAVERTVRALEEVGAHVTEYAQANATWQDQTGAARAGLLAEVSGFGGVIVLVFGHTVEYGIWLEVRWGGRYAIVMHAMEASYADIMAALQVVLKP